MLKNNPHSPNGAILVNIRMICLHPKENLWLRYLCLFLPFLPYSTLQHVLTSLLWTSAFHSAVYLYGVTIEEWRIYTD